MQQECRVVVTYSVFSQTFQEVGEAVVIAPLAYHGGLNLGFNIATATNFAFPDWVDYGLLQDYCDCDFETPGGTPAPKLVFPMEGFAHKYRESEYKQYMDGVYRKVHPVPHLGADGQVVAKTARPPTIEELLWIAEEFRTPEVRQILQVYGVEKEYMKRN